MSDTVVNRPKLVAPRHMVDQLLTHLRAGTTDLCPEVQRLDPSIFVDPDIARREVEGIFATVPFIAIHGSELPEPYDFVTKRLPRDEAVFVRQGDGSVKAFVNMCRHRGSLLLEEPAGHCRVISCAYHGWSYDADGTLRAITYPDSFGDVDRSELGLVELPVEERHGFVWVIDRPGATIDVAAALGPETDEFLASYHLDELTCFRAGTFVEPVNWKIMHDAFLDGYHIKFAHPNSAARVVHSNTYVVEDYGRHARFTSPRKSLDQWLDHDPDPDEPMLGHVMMAHFIGPNATLLQLEDNFQLLTFAPISDDPTTSQMEMRLLVPPVGSDDLESESWTARWEKNWHILQVVLTGEDFPILRGIQRAYTSSSATPTILGRNEILNQAFHREVARLRDAVV
jgi:phenylpropionate dioxygenase-like ring-hydroxylating dioxygenase large terminal subunit